MHTKPIQCYKDENLISGIKQIFSHNMPRWCSWNTAKVGIKHQVINQSTHKFVKIRSNDKSLEEYIGFYDLKRWRFMLDSFIVFQTVLNQFVMIFTKLRIGKTPISWKMFNI